MWKKDFSAACLVLLLQKRHGSSPLPCGYMPTNCKELHMRTITVSTMFFVERVGLETYAKGFNDKYFRVCYSFHSSYSEVRDMVLYLQPVRAVPNVIPLGETMERVINCIMFTYVHKGLTLTTFSCYVHNILRYTMWEHNNWDMIAFSYLLIKILQPYQILRFSQCWSTSYCHTLNLILIFQLSVLQLWLHGEIFSGYLSFILMSCCDSLAADITYIWLNLSQT